MKKALSLILAVVMLISCFVGMTFTTSAEETEYSEDISTDVSTDNVGTYMQNFGVLNTNDDTLSFKTYVNYDFVAFSFGIYSNSATATSFTYSLYKWDTSLEKTLESDPIASKKFENFVQGDTSKWEFDEPMPAGEYLFRISDVSSWTCLIPLWKDVPSSYAVEGVCYLGTTIRTDIVVPLTVYTTNENYVSGTMFSKEAPVVEETTAPETTAPAPEETTAPETTTPEPEVPAVPEYSENAMPGVRSDFYPLASTNTVSYRTYVNYAFHAFSFVSRKRSDATPYCTFSLYKWDTSLEKTLEGEPIVSQKFEGFEDGTINKLEFETQPAGEYLFHVSNSNIGVDFNRHTGVSDMKGTSYAKKTERTDLTFSLAVYTTDESYTEGTMFSKEAPAPAETYIYENSLDGNQYTYQGHEALDVNNLSDDVRAKFDLYANGSYNKLIDFEHVSSIEGVHLYRSVHDTTATVTVNGETATPAEGDVYYLLKADVTDGEGVPFYGWYDDNAKIYLSYNATYKFFPDSASENITAVYKVAEKEIVANVTATRTENKLTVTVTPNYPSDVTNVKYGYYISTDAAALDVNNITASGDSTVAPHVYMVRVYDVQATTQEKNIYLLGWISYGEEAPLYTSLITVAPDGTVTIA